MTKRVSFAAYAALVGCLSLASACANPVSPAVPLLNTAPASAGLPAHPQHVQNPPRGDESGLVSPFPSTIEGIDIPNAHLVVRGAGEVLRGMSPAGRTAELARHGVTDIVIFKDELKGDVTKEIAELERNGYTPDRIHAIPFRWRDITGFQDACEQMIDALQVLETAYRTRGRSAFFHCTVGEDRTGMLAGVFRMVEMPEQGWNARKAFKEEMCMHGYEAGNPQKPDFVVEIIRRELTPVFLKLATLIENGEISAGKLDRSVCRQNPEPRYDAREFVCAASPLFSAH